MYEERDTSVHRPITDIEATGVQLKEKNIHRVVYNINGTSW